jgi:hypothetical protein
MRGQGKWWVATSVGGAGLLSILLGWQAYGTNGSYLASLLLDLGIAVLLAIPIALIGRLFAERVRGIRQDVEELKEELARSQTPIAKLSDSVRQSLDQTHKEENATITAVRQDASFANVWKMLTIAQEAKAISTTVIVRLPDNGCCLEVLSIDEPFVNLTYRLASHDVSVSVLWTSDMDARAAFTKLAQNVERENVTLGQDIFDPSRLLSKLADTVEIAWKAKRARTVESVSEAPNEHWVFGDVRSGQFLPKDVLAHVGNPEAAIESELFADASDAAEEHDRIAALPWVKDEGLHYFEDAWQLAESRWSAPAAPDDEPDHSPADDL